MKIINPDRLVYLCFILWALFPLTPYTQPNVLHPGDTIRVQSSNYFQRAAVGRLVNIHKHSLTFTVQGGRDITLASDRVQKLQVARGMKRNTKQGDLLGAVSTGLIVGLGAAFDASREQEKENEGFSFSITPSP